MPAASRRVLRTAQQGRHLVFEIFEAALLRSGWRERRRLAAGRYGRAAFPAQPAAPPARPAGAGRLPAAAPSRRDSGRRSTARGPEGAARRRRRRRVQAPRPAFRRADRRQRSRRRRLADAMLALSRTGVPHGWRRLTAGGLGQRALRPWHQRLAAGQARRGRFGATADRFRRKARQRIAATFRHRRRRRAAEFVGEGGPRGARRRLGHLRFGMIECVGRSRSRLLPPRRSRRHRAAARSAAAARRPPGAAPSDRGRASRARYWVRPRCRSGRRSSGDVRHCRAGPAPGAGGRPRRRRRSRPAAASARAGCWRRGGCWRNGEPAMRPRRSAPERR